MDEINIKQINATIEINKEGVKILVEAISLLIKNKIECNCETCKQTDIKVRVKKIFDLYTTNYRLSKLTNVLTKIPCLNDIENEINNVKNK
jgi:hypothetical protein